MGEIEKIAEISERLKQLAYAQLGIVITGGKKEGIRRYIAESNKLRQELKAIHRQLLKTPLID